MNALGRDLKVAIAGDATTLLSAVNRSERSLEGLLKTARGTSDGIVTSNRLIDDSFLGTARAQEAAATAILRQHGYLDAAYKKQVAGALETSKAQATAAREILASNAKVTASERETLNTTIHAAVQRQAAAMAVLGSERQQAAAVEATATKTVAADRKIVAASEETGGALQKIHKHALAGAVAVAGVFGGYEAAKGAVTDTLALAKATAVFSTTTGASVQQSSELVAVMQALGLTSGQVSLAVKALARANEEQIANTKGSATAFSKLGISQQEAAAHSHDMIGLLELVANRLQGVAGGTEKTVLMQQLFGKGWQAINPLIRDGGKNLQGYIDAAAKYGVTLSAKTLPQLSELVKAQKNAQLASGGLKLAFTEIAGKPMIDFEERLASILNDIRSGNWADLSKQTTQLGDGLERVIQAVTPKVADAFAQSAPKILLGLLHGFSQASLGGELIIGGLLVKRLGLASAFATAGVSAGKAFLLKLGIGAETGAAVEGAVAGRTFGVAFDAGAAESVGVGAGAAGAAGGIRGLLAKIGLGGAAAEGGVAAEGALAGEGFMAAFGAAALAAAPVALGGLLAFLGQKAVQSVFPGITGGGLSAAPGEGLGGGKVAPGLLDPQLKSIGGGYGNGSFTPAAGTNYTFGEEPIIAQRLSMLAKSLGLHLTGVSGYRTPAHSVAVGGFANDPHTKGLASDTPGIERVPESTLEQFGLTRPFSGASEADHIQLLPGAKVPGLNVGAGILSGVGIRSGGAAAASGWRTVGASMYGGAGDPTSGHNGYKGDNLDKGPLAFAELGMGHNLGGLPYGAALTIRYKGRTVTAYKLDIGLGGGNVKGKRRDIDLYYRTAAALGFTAGIDLVEIRTGGGAIKGSPKSQSQLQTAAFSAYQQAVSDVNLEGQAALLSPAQVAIQERQIGAQALAGRFGPLDAHATLQVRADIVGAGGGTAALLGAESAAQKKILGVQHRLALADGATAARYDAAANKAIAAQQHTEALQALFPTDLSTPAGAARALGNLKEQKAAKSHTKSIYEDELAAVKREIAAWTRSRDAYRGLARKTKGAAKTAALNRAAGIQAEIDQAQADANTIGGNISDAAITIQSLDIQITQTTADAAAQQQSTDFGSYQQANSDVDLQVSAGLLTPEQGAAAKQQNAHNALAGGYGPLSQRDTWQVMADLRNATQNNTTALDANTQATLDNTKAQLQMALAAGKISNLEFGVVVKALADIISGQIAGRDLAGRSATAGSGLAAVY